MRHEAESRSGLQNFNAVPNADFAIHMLCHQILTEENLMLILLALSKRPKRLKFIQRLRLEPLIHVAGSWVDSGHLASGTRLHDTKHHPTNTHSAPRVLFKWLDTINNNVWSKAVHRHLSFTASSEAFVQRSKTSRRNEQEWETVSQTNRRCFSKPSPQSCWCVLWGVIAPVFGTCGHEPWSKITANER